MIRVNLFVTTIWYIFKVSIIQQIWNTIGEGRIRRNVLVDILMELDWKKK